MVSDLFYCRRFNDGFEKLLLHYYNYQILIDFRFNFYEYIEITWLLIETNQAAIGQTYAIKENFNAFHRRSSCA